MQVFKTAQAVTQPFRITRGPATVVIGGLDDLERVEIHVWDGRYYSQLIDWRTGDPVIFSPEKPHGLLEGPGLYQAFKDPTVKEVSMLVIENG